MVSWKEESLYPSRILQYDLSVHSIVRTLHVCVIVKSKTDFVVSGNKKKWVPNILRHYIVNPL